MQIRKLKEEYETKIKKITENLTTEKENELDIA